MFSDEPCIDVVGLQVRREYTTSCIKIAMECLSFYYFHSQIPLSLVTATNEDCLRRLIASSTLPHVGFSPLWSHFLNIAAHPSIDPRLA